MTFKSVGEIAAFPGTNPFTGTCPEHGESTVLIFSFQKNQAWFCSECASVKVRAEDGARWLRERREAIYRSATLPEKYLGRTFPATSAAMRTARAQAKAFLDQLKRERLWATLIMIGKNGTGKTLLATELAEYMINKMSLTVRYCTANQMVSEIQASYSTEGKTQEGEILRFANYDVLIIDEIDAKPDKENANILLTEVINRRYNSLRPVIAISNQPLDMLHKFVGDRVESRLHENSFVCSFNWPDFRKLPMKP
ncbi:ATP-binding protein [Pseudoduganella sp. UC29_106]|uniref:ATP-binding protein n=1 Tax=Pseudoduganella sp. UC29_106 TaxID=3374553 RepID=UPI003756431B